MLLKEEVISKSGRLIEYLGSYEYVARVSGAIIPVAVWSRLDRLHATHARGCVILSMLMHRHPGRTGLNKHRGPIIENS